MNEWISVKKRLPERSCSYLVHFRSGVIDKLHFNHKVKKWIAGNDHVTHWMPLPEKPKEE